MTSRQWTIISCIAGICASAIFLFYPDYEGNDFPLFTDITTFLLFLPSYFLLCCAIIPLVIALLTPNKVAKLGVIFVVCTTAFFNSFQYIFFESINFKLLVIFLTLLPTFIFGMVVLAVKSNRIVHTSV